MIPAAFEYARASSVEEASKLLGKFGEDAKLLAGGHSLIPLMRLRLAQPTALVDINNIKELSYIRPENGSLRVGRSRIGILDRNKLQKVACECYRVICARRKQVLTETITANL